MQPVVTPREMNQIDADALASTEELIERAGWAVARAALAVFAERDDGRGAYGRRALVLVGVGNNGADGVSAARFLRRRGVDCRVVNVFDQPDQMATIGDADFDLIIDACLGTGLSRRFDALSGFDAGSTPVLAVDIPSGVDGVTGQLNGSVVKAHSTITFGALKPGMLLEPGATMCGRIEVADIGLDCGRASIHHLSLDDVLALWPKRPVESHKWMHSVAVIGGRPSMIGAVSLTARAAMRAGASAVGLAVPGLDLSVRYVPPVEAIQLQARPGWSRLLDLDRYTCAVVGPGLTVNPEMGLELADYVRYRDLVTVFDAGALRLLSAELPLRAHDDRWSVLTPHDGEYASLFGSLPGQDRIEAARAGARAAGAILLLKGPTTVVANPDGDVLVSTAGDQRLGTAGSGDVLAGTIAAGIAGGLDSFIAAGIGAELHGQAARRGYETGLLAGDLCELLPEVLRGI